VDQSIYRFYIRPNGPRPEFRVVKAFLWSDAQNVSSDGDSYNPASREWTYLFLHNRDNAAEMVMVDKVVSEAALVFEIKSSCEYMAARCAYFLAVQTNSNVAETLIGSASNPDGLVEKMGAGFGPDAAMRRAEQSPFSRSTLENPYPNRS